METMKRKNKVATVKMEKMERPGGKAVLAAEGVQWCKAAQLRQAGSRVHREGVRRYCGQDVKQGGRDDLTLNQPLGEDGRMLRMESRQWMIETQC